MKFYTATFSLLLSLAHGSPTVPYAIHERRQGLSQGWEKLGRIPSDHVLEMKVALKESNLDLGLIWLDEVSNPTSSKYGKHWSAQEVAEAFKPSDESINSVLDWLSAAGISGHRLSRGKNWVHINASIAQAEQMLKTEYSMHSHRDGVFQIACDEYSLPASVQKHVDFIYPTIQFTQPTRGGPVHRDDRREKRAAATSVPALLNGATFKGLFEELKQCANFTTPNCLRALYTFTENFYSNPKNSYGIVEYTPQTFIASDLDVFFRNFSPRAVGSRPDVNLIDGAVLQQEETGFEYIGESSLDLQFAMALVYPQQVTLYQVGDLQMGASFNNLLDAIDSSYCSYMGGDDPENDGIYPDTLPGGYQGNDCGKFPRTNVISTSYGYNEADLPPSYAQRQCNEYMKLGMMGTTIVYSSGDDGVAGNGAICLDPSTKQLNDLTTGAFAPSFSSTCPYVLSIGATKVIPYTNVVQARLQGQQPERACQTVIHSGGGFSNVFPIPAYQKFTVTNWFKNHPSGYTASQFNNSMQTRAYPDISANGANYLVALSGAFRKVYGTSASAPTVGSLITLINNARLAIGKGPVGFVNPALYAHPEVLKDVTVGGNPGCGTPGFSSVQGWDPVTGLGTPNFSKLLALFLALP